MKVSADQIKRPRLIEPFFNEELLPNNEFVVYIETTNDKVSTPKHSLPNISLNPDEDFYSWCKRNLKYLIIYFCIMNKIPFDPNSDNFLNFLYDHKGFFRWVGDYHQYLFNRLHSSDFFRLEKLPYPHPHKYRYSSV